MNGRMGELTFIWLLLTSTFTKYSHFADEEMEPCGVGRTRSHQAGADTQVCLTPNPMRQPLPGVVSPKQECSGEGNSTKSWGASSESASPTFHLNTMMTDSLGQGA